MSRADKSRILARRADLAPQRRRRCILACARHVGPLVLIILLGCNKTPRRSSVVNTGDVGSFVLRILESHGGHTVTTNDLPQFNAPYSYKITSNAQYLDERVEFDLRLPPDRFSDLTNYLCCALGNPSHPAALTPDRGLHGYYTIGDIGVALQFYQNQHESGLILVGPESGKPSAIRSGLNR
jgi:hypothetical protein